jgi:hypothetical protein
MKTLRQRIALAVKFGLSKKAATQLARLKTPEAVQDFITHIPINFEPGGDTCLGVNEVIKQRRAHCIEGAFVAACALWLQGHKPLLLDLQAKGDFDHVVAIFKRGKYWGAISKSNHVWLRWRDPVYRSLRELAMSYFHEYVSGKSKTLWAYSAPFDLSKHDPKLWISAMEDCWEMETALDTTRHFRLITAKQAKNLKPRDRIERQADKLRDYVAPKKRK